MKIISEETPKYNSLLLRKTFKVKAIETIVFLMLVALLSYTLGYSHPYFKHYTLLLALATLGLSPFFYKIIVNPKFTLTDRELIIKKFNKDTKISLNNIKETNDIRYYYLINDKKTPLNVSNSFLDDLDKQLVQLKKNMR